MLQFAIDNPSKAGQGDALLAVDPLWQELWNQLNGVTLVAKSNNQWAKVIKNSIILISKQFKLQSTKRD